MSHRAHRVLVGVLAGVALALAVTAGPAGAATFGTDLSSPTTGTVSCGSAFSTSSCLVYSVTPSSYAPSSGIVNTVRVRTGPGPVGPMQVVVLRSYYQNNLSDPGHPSFTCCGLQEYGPTFMPAANTVNTVPVNLGMVEQPTPAPSDGNTVAIGDFLALSVLSGDAVIPMSPNPASSFSAAFNAPAPTPATLAAPSPAGVPGGRGGYGYTLMMNADFTPLDGGGGGGAGAGGGGAPGTPGVPTPAPGTGPVAPPTTAATKPVLLKQHGARLSRTAASLPLTCKLTATCAGTVTVRDRAIPATARTAAARAGATARTAAATRAKAATKPRKAVVLGTARFSVAAGKTKTLKVKLNAAGRRKVGHRRTLVVYVTATVGGTPVTTKVTLKR